MRASESNPERRRDIVSGPGNHPDSFDPLADGAGQKTSYQEAEDNFHAKGAAINAKKAMKDVEKGLKEAKYKEAR